MQSEDLISTSDLASVRRRLAGDGTESYLIAFGGA